MTSIIKYGMKLLTCYHGKNVDVQELINNFIHNLLGMWLNIHLGIKVNPC